MLIFRNNMLLFWMVEMLSKIILNLFVTNDVVININLRNSKILPFFTVVINQCL